MQRLLSYISRCPVLNSCSSTSGACKVLVWDGTGSASFKSVSSAAGSRSALRAFLRYLQVVGLMTADLAALVIAPQVRAIDRPRRAVPWNDVRRIPRAIDARAPLGLRDKALFLLMATYDERQENS